MTEYQEQAMRFLKESGTKMTIRRNGSVDGFPFDDKDTHPHNRYEVNLERNGMSYSFQFYGSYMDWKNDTDPNEYDVLACMTKYDVGTMADFVEEFGYRIVDRKSFNKVEKAWKACKDEYRNLALMFGDEWMDQLCEIQ